MEPLAHDFANSKYGKYYYEYWFCSQAFLNTLPCLLVHQISASISPYSPLGNQYILIEQVVSSSKEFVILQERIYIGIKS